MTCCSPPGCSSSSTTASARSSGLDVVYSESVGIGGRTQRDEPSATTAVPLSFRRPATLSTSVTSSRREVRRLTFVDSVGRGKRAPSRRRCSPLSTRMGVVGRNGFSPRGSVWSRRGLNFFTCVLGGVLLSRTLAGAVPSALSGLASGFGMGPGVSLSL